MDKFTAFHTAIDAIVFLLSNADALDISHNRRLSLGAIYEHISKLMSDKVFDFTAEKKDA